MKRKRDKEEENDRLSDLPDFVLLRIMEFMNTKEAVQTCVLSTRWKDLWRHLTNLALKFRDFASLFSFSRFLRSMLSHRDGSISLHDINLGFGFREFEAELLHSVMTYAVSHNVQKLSVRHMFLQSGYLMDSCIFSCQSLTHLKLSIWSVAWKIELPTSLQLPALKCLFLQNVALTANDNGIVDPFSNCHMLKTLVVSFCIIQPKGKFIRISNSKLSGLTITTSRGVIEKIVLSTPNLSSVTLFCGLIPQVSACDLSFLEQVNFDVRYLPSEYESIYSSLIIWLQVLANYVKILTLSSKTLKALLLRTSDSIITQLPCFVKLKSLKLKVKSSNIPDEEVRMLVNCFLKKCPVAKVFIDGCAFKA